MTLSFGTAVLVLIAGLGLLVLGTPPATAFLVALVVLLAGLAIAWSSLLRRSTRMATRLVMGHDRFETRDFERITGGPMPCDAKAWTRWLAEHPGDLQGFPFLVALGRLDDAERLLDAEVRTNDDERFQDARARALLALLRNETPDLPLLETRLLALRDPLEYQHRSACVAIIGAEMAVDRDQDPTSILIATAERVGVLGTGSEWLMSLVPAFAYPVFALALVGIVGASLLP
jgi:hypothetical protein